MSLSRRGPSERRNGYLPGTVLRHLGRYFGGNLDQPVFSQRVLARGAIHANVAFQCGSDFFDSACFCQPRP